MTSEQIVQEYASFVKEMLARAKALGTDLHKYPIDHVCYRISTPEQHEGMFEIFKSMSVMYTRKFFHERNFYTFFLRQPLSYEGINVYFIEFSQPGGSDSYATGFQHLEVLTPLQYTEIFPNNEELTKLLFQGKFADEEGYVKWEDKKVIKLKRKTIAYEATAEDGSEIIVV